MMSTVPISLVPNAHYYVSPSKSNLLIRLNIEASLTVDIAPYDSRSPCPALNALANHGYISRNGRNLKIPVLAKAVQRVYNLSTPLAYGLALLGVLLCGNGRSVDLDHLARHNRIEHDASLSRQDVRPFHAYAPVAADHCLIEHILGLSSHGLYMTLEDLARARVFREAAIIGPPLDQVHAEIGKGEISLILEVFGGRSGRVPKEVLRALLAEGRLPDDWKRPDKVVGLVRLFLKSRRVASAMAVAKRSYLK